MDPNLNGFSDSIDAVKLGDEIFYPSFGEAPSLLNGFQSKEDTFNVNFSETPWSPPVLDPANFVSPVSTGSEVDSPDDNDSDPVLKYLNQILLEENMDERPSMFVDPLAVQAAEKSLYDALGEKYPTLPYQQNQNADSPDSLFGNSSECSITSSTTSSSSADPHWVVDPGDYRPLGAQNYATDYSSRSPQVNAHNYATDYSSRSPQVNVQNYATDYSSRSPQVSVQNYATDYSSRSPQMNAQLSIDPSSNFGEANGQFDGFTNGNLFQNIFYDSESVLQFKKGMEEASKFLPTSNQLIIDLDNYNLPPKSDEVLPNPSIKLEKDESEDSLSGSRGRKHLHRQESELEQQRSSKQSAVYVEESQETELSEMFDRVLLFRDANGNPTCCDAHIGATKAEKIPEQNGVKGGSAGARNRSRNQGSKSEAVDLRTLLISCAQSVAADDRRTANEQLKQIRQHSSPTGDAYQRLANVFANGLEARLAGTGTEIYAALRSRRVSATEKLKAYQVYLSACPFKKISIFFANKMILHAASKATTLHIVDFGILYGFQWPILIQHLSNLPGGPPRLRITGIEHPQPGFRPAELVEETGRRLARYCELFNVPFEYETIATQNWESIKIEDLKIKQGEVLAVNSLFRFKNLLDETVAVDNPRDAVLKLIRKMNPDIYVNSFINGSFSAPFFVTRFREALFHYSSLFDMFDATLPREDEHRVTFEQAFYGREAMNVISCEGLERVERPETYKQWQVRHKRAGFKPLPLKPELLNKLRCKVKAGYHKDFVFDEDGCWMLQGWKGRIICASSWWVPA